VGMFGENVRVGCSGRLSGGDFLWGIGEGMSGGCFGEIFQRIFHRGMSERMSRENCLSGRPHLSAALQISTCSSHPG